MVMQPDSTDTEAAPPDTSVWARVHEAGQSSTRVGARPPVTFSAEQ
jgi:hypothetical protein